MKNNIPIFLASNDNYAPFVATTITSICYNTKSFIDFYILDGGIVDFRKKQIEALKEKFNNFSIEFIKIDFESVFENFKEHNYWSLDMYSRFLIPILKPNIDKAIYLDVDIIVLGNIKELYEEDLGEYFLGAIPETTNMKVLAIRKKLLTIDGDSQYFNSGVLLIDCKKWRENNILKSLLDLEKELRLILKCPDQDLLNKYFDKKYKKLNIKYNLLNGQIYFKDKLEKIEREEINTAIQNPMVRHFEGHCKPWLFVINEYGQKIKYFNEFWFYAKMTNFYEGLLNEFNKSDNTTYKTKVKLFGFLPILLLKNYNKKVKLYLFGFIPLLTIKGK